MDQLNEYQEEQLIRNNESIQRLLTLTLHANKISMQQGITAMLLLAIEAKFLSIMEKTKCTPAAAKADVKDFISYIIDAVEDEDLQESFDSLMHKLSKHE